MSTIETHDIETTGIRAEPTPGAVHLAHGAKLLDEAVDQFKAAIEAGLPPIGLGAARYAHDELASIARRLGNASVDLGKVSAYLQAYAGKVCDFLDAAEG